MLTQNLRLTGIVTTVAVILAIPFVAMQVTNEVTWTMFDFIVAGILLLSTGLLVELILRKVKKKEHRIALCGVLLMGLLLIWLELAVGIFGSPIAGS